MNGRNLHLVASGPEPGETGPQIGDKLADHPAIKDELRRGRHDSGVKKLPAPQERVYDPEGSFADTPTYRGRHERATARQRLEELQKNLGRSGVESIEEDI